MKLTLLASLTLLGLALAAATDPTADDIGSTKVTDGNLDVRALITYILIRSANLTAVVSRSTTAANAANMTGNVVAETAATSAVRSAMSAMAAAAKGMIEVDLQ
ncbi:hypothetical protein AbraIFM66951_004973 [Aspergillus brasiliensis]|uniref:Uncharacterized protein n=1 Tax=Aspergillus brasiliensis TaxID=319629 RepID=A0A9W6DMM2_9EURO|nr:hypothetical protein AbraCBS73388_009029 [Aspergillus brasiliensis]GKZ43607.1 hypothetical protein AbraIFM66951_004973 [Aspergillus brasiliensis]